MSAKKHHQHRDNNSHLGNSVSTSSSASFSSPTITSSSLLSSSDARKRSRESNVTAVDGPTSVRRRKKKHHESASASLLDSSVEDDEADRTNKDQDDVDAEDDVQEISKSTLKPIAFVGNSMLGPKLHGQFDEPVLTGLDDDDIIQEDNGDEDMTNAHQDIGDDDEHTDGDSATRNQLHVVDQTHQSNGSVRLQSDIEDGVGADIALSDKVEAVDDEVNIRHNGKKAARANDSALSNQSSSVFSPLSSPFTKSSTKTSVIQQSGFVQSSSLSNEAGGAVASAQSSCQVQGKKKYTIVKPSSAVPKMKESKVTSCRRMILKHVTCVSFEFDVWMFINSPSSLIVFVRLWH